MACRSYKHEYRSCRQKYRGARHSAALALMIATGMAGVAYADVNADLADTFAQVCLPFAPRFEGSIHRVAELGFASNDNGFGYYEFWTEGIGTIGGTISAGTSDDGSDLFCEVHSVKANLGSVRDQFEQMLVDHYGIIPAHHEYHWTESSGWKLIISNWIYDIQIYDGISDTPGNGFSVVLSPRR